jgi:hypothetical protein
LLHAEVAFENFVARGGGRFDAVLAPGSADLEAEDDELNKCERSHDIDISHGCSLDDGGFYHPIRARFSARLAHEFTP